MSKSSSSGIGLPGFLFLIFLVMKLAKIGAVAEWSWWWVTAPLWGGVALLIIGLIIYVGVSLIINARKVARRKSTGHQKKGGLQMRLEEEKNRRARK